VGGGGTTELSRSIGLRSPELRSICSGGVTNGESSIMDGAVLARAAAVAAARESAARCTPVLSNVGTVPTPSIPKPAHASSSNAGTRGIPGAEGGAPRCIVRCHEDIHHIRRDRTGPSLSNSRRFDRGACIGEDDRSGHFAWETPRGAVTLQQSQSAWMARPTRRSGHAVALRATWRVHARVVGQLRQRRRRRRWWRRPAPARSQRR
jgi:hypothetical protein